MAAIIKHIFTVLANKQSYNNKQDHISGVFGIVLPTITLRKVFVTFDVDNLDSHSQGNFSHEEFYGTAISVTNHLSWDNLCIKRPCITLDPTDASVPQLPETYSVVQPAELPSHDVFVPCTANHSSRPSHNLVPGAKIKDECCMAHVPRCFNRTH